MPPDLFGLGADTDKIIPARFMTAITRHGLRNFGCGSSRENASGRSPTSASAASSRRVSATCSQTNVRKNGLLLIRLYDEESA